MDGTCLCPIFAAARRLAIVRSFGKLKMEFNGHLGRGSKLRVRVTLILLPCGELIVLIDIIVRVFGRVIE